LTIAIYIKVKKNSKLKGELNTSIRLYV